MILGFETISFIAKNVVSCSLTCYLPISQQGRAELGNVMESYFKEILQLVGLTHGFYIKYVAFEEHSLISTVLIEKQGNRGDPQKRVSMHRDSITW